MGLRSFVNRKVKKAVKIVNSVQSAANDALTRVVGRRNADAAKKHVRKLLGKAISHGAGIVGGHIAGSGGRAAGRLIGDRVIREVI